MKIKYRIISIKRRGVYFVQPILGAACVTAFIQLVQLPNKTVRLKMANSCLNQAFEVALLFGWAALFGEKVLAQKYIFPNKMTVLIE